LNADEYEAIGLCYQELQYYIPDADVSFVSKAVDEPRRTKGKPKTDRLNALYKGLSRAAHESQEQQGADFFMLRSELLQMLQCFECPDGMEERECVGIGLFYLLVALDEYVKLELQRAQEFGEAYRISPLNHGQSLRTCQVHWKERGSFLSGAYKLGRQGFRDPLVSSDLGDVFKSFRIIETRRLALFRQGMQPNIVRVPLSDVNREAICRKKTVRIASIPFIGFNTFHFHEAVAENPCPPNTAPEGDFYIEYSHEEEEQNSHLIVTLLKMAIEQKANLIVFPEFVVSPETRKKIAKCLDDMKKISQVVLVFAGTTYEWDSSTQRGNNVLHILNHRGKEIGKYYKYSPFLTRSQNGIHEAMEEKPEGEYTTNPCFKNMELLSDPGKECTLLDVEEIGRILPAVCRDIVDGKYTSGLVDLFRPSMILAPAWSRSVRSFDTYLKHYANTTHTASLLCNCCNAVGFPEYDDKGKKETGRFCLPRKKGSTMDAELQPVCRPEGCLDQCHERGGCIVFIDVDFSAGMPTVRVETPVYPK